MRCVALLFVGIHLAFNAVKTEEIPHSTFLQNVASASCLKESDTEAQRPEGKRSKREEESRPGRQFLFSFNSGRNKQEEKDLRHDDMKVMGNELITAEDFFKATCENVTGNVGEKLNLICRFSYQRYKCCKWTVMFGKLMSDDGTEIDSLPFFGSCGMVTSFSYPYTANKAMTTKFKLETTYDRKTKFTVNLTGGTDNINTIITDYYELTCVNVTGNVGNELSLTCRVSYQNDPRCIRTPISMRIVIDNTKQHTSFCQDDFKYNPCLQWTRFSCPYPTNEATATSILFFLDSTYKQTTEFTVNITGPTTDVLTNKDLTEEEMRFPEMEYEDFSEITCENVVGNVGENLTLTCRVPYQRNELCIEGYSFMRIVDGNYKTICEERFSDYKQMTSFSCPYTANITMTSEFLLSLDAECGFLSRKFTVNITDGDDNDITAMTASEVTVISVGCVLPLIVFIAVMGVIVWRKTKQLRAER